MLKKLARRAMDGLALRIAIRIGACKDFLALERTLVLIGGPWDGFYSFAAEAMGGACRVVALDHFVWRADWLAKREYKATRLAHAF